MIDDDDLSIADDELPDLPLEGPDNAADPRDLKRKRRRVSKDVREQVVFWRGVLGTKDGRRQAYRLLRDTGFFEAFFMVSPVGFPDLEASAYKRGRHDNGLRMLFDWMKFARAETFLMLDENDDRFKPYALMIGEISNG